MFSYLVFGYSLNGYKSGHNLILYKTENDTIFYAVHGKRISTQPFGDHLIINDTLVLKEKNIIDQFCTKGNSRKGWKDKDFIPHYMHNYCFYYKKSSEKFVIIDDNELNIDMTCEENSYYEMFEEE
jgi:hypothetical protein